MEIKCSETEKVHNFGMIESGTVFAVSGQFYIRVKLIYKINDLQANTVNLRTGVSSFFMNEQIIKIYENAVMVTGRSHK